MAGPSSRKRSDVSVDFSGVESGGFSVPDDEYLLEVVSIEEKESKEGNPYLAWKWKIAEGPFKGATLYDNTSLTQKALWRLKMLLECIGEEVPNGKAELNFKSYVGKTSLANVANETYQGKQKPRIVDFIRQDPSKTTSSKSDKLKKGSKVSFAYEDSEMTGTVNGYEGGKVIVQVIIDDTEEEWEMEESELTPA